MSDATTRNYFVPLKYNTVFLVLTVLLITSTVLVWSVSKREKEYIESQKNMVESSVNGVANQISSKISDLRQGIKLFAEKEQFLLRQIVKKFDNLDAYDQLVAIAKKEFPNAVAITVADQLGEPYIEDFDGFILDVCLRDIKSFAGLRHTPEVYIHPNPLAYHFDIMVKVNVGLDEQTIFFMSFSPDLISRILNNGELYSHKLMLIKNDSSNLVEVTSKGSRDTLSINNLHLSEDDIKEIVYSRPVSNTSWNLVDRPVHDYAEKHIKEIWNETIYIILLLFFFSLLMLFIQRKTERKAKHRTEAAILEKVAAQDASKAKSLFLANMSHEIRTPLTAIIGYGETLLRSDQSMKDRIEAVNTVISSGEHLLNLINDILDVSKIEAQKLVLEKTRVSPYQIIHEVEQIISGQTKRKKVQFTIEYDFPLPAVIVSDPVRVKQILLNLCSNAIKFTDRGYIRVTMRHEHSLNLLYFIVQDSGIGMSEESMRVVFDSFTQADSSTTRKYGGSGLGLTLSKQLALLLGGDIGVDSKLGIGSTFAFYIPTNVNSNEQLVYDIKDIPAFTSEKEQQVSTEKLSGNVLIAEDNINNQKLIKRHLEKMGLTIHTVDNGQRAIERAMSSDFDLVFMDIQMPVMGGLDAVLRLRERGFDKPIVALTANALQEDKEKCLSVGCNAYATKPIHYEQLYQIARKYLPTVPDTLIESPIYSTLMNDDEDYFKLIRVFVRDLQPTIKSLLSKYEESDWEDLMGAIHQLKGLGGGYGFPDITSISSKIEFQLVNKNYLEVAALLKDLGRIIERITLGDQKNESDPRKVAGI